MIKSVELPGQGSSNWASYSIASASTNPSEVKVTYESIANALAADAGLRLSFGRFNSALGRENNTDKIIDMTICLESIFSSGPEIKFRFALYNALLASQGLEERKASFKLMKDLYNMRSKVVHGSHELDRNWFVDNWPAILRIAKLALLAKIEFLQTFSRSEWQDHLDELALDGGVQ